MLTLFDVDRKYGYSTTRSHTANVKLNSTLNAQKPLGMCPLVGTSFANGDRPTIYRHRSELICGFRDGGAIFRWVWVWVCVCVGGGGGALNIERFLLLLTEHFFILLKSCKWTK